MMMLGPRVSRALIEGLYKGKQQLRIRRRNDFDIYDEREEIEYA